MINRKGAFKPVVHQVGVEIRHLLRQHHAFVNDRPAAQRTDIKVFHRGSRFLDPAADNVELAFKLFLFNPFGVGDQDLLNLGPGCVGLLAQTRDIDRHMAPSIDAVAHAQHFGFDNRAARFLRAEISAGQEDLAHRNHLFLIRRMAGPLDLIIEEGHRDLDVNTGPITGLSIRINRASMPDCLQRIDAVLHNLARLFPIDRDNEPDTARGMLFRLPIQAVLRHPSAFCVFLSHPVFIELGHVSSPLRIGGRARALSDRPAYAGHLLRVSTPVLK